MAPKAGPKPPKSNPHISIIEDGIYLSDLLSASRPEILRGNNIAAVVSLLGEECVHWSQPWYREIIHEDDHMFVPCDDSMTQDLLHELADICDFIDSRRDSGFPVLVHCGKGVSRSAMALVAYLYIYLYSVLL